MATFEFDINGTIPGTLHDRFTSTGGDISLGGANLDLSLGFTPTIGQTFSILTTSGAGNTISGQFAQGGSIVADGQAFAITYNSTSVVLTSLGTSPTLTWDGGGATNNWSEAANWNPNIVPVDGLDLIFSGGAPADSLSNNNDISGVAARSLAFTAGGFTISGNAISLSNGITNTASSGNIDLNNNFTLPQAQTFQNNITVTRIDGQVNLNGFALTVDGSSNLNLAGPVVGGGGIVKNGTGVLFLQQSNSYTGTTQINNGIIQVENTNGLGASGAANNTVVASGATLRPSQNVQSIPEAITLNGTGVGGFGVLLASGCNSCSISGAITLASTSTVGVNPSNTVTLNGTISGGTNGLTKVGAGTLILSVANGYTGTTTVNAGTLLVNGNNIVSPVSLTGGTLGGVGTVDGINATGGTVAPGQSPGTLTSSSTVVFNAATTFDVEIGGLYRRHAV